LAKKARSIRRANIAGWLFNVSRRISARAAQRRFHFQQLHETVDGPAEHPLHQKELFQLLDAEVSRLPPRLRLPVLLCYLGERSTEDAARELRCPRGTILSRLSTARKHLERRLARRGIAFPASLPVAGILADGRLVSATLTAKSLFLSKSQPLDSASLLAKGVLKTMNYFKTFTVIGAVILALGLIGGIEWVAAESKPGAAGGNALSLLSEPEHEQPPAKKEVEKQAKIAEPTSKNEASKQVIRNLQELAVELRSKLDALEEEEATRIKRHGMEIDPKDEINLQMTQSRYNLERELLLDEIHEKANRVLLVRRQLDVLAEEGKSDRVETKNLKVILKGRMEELELSKNTLMKLQEMYLPEIAKYQARVSSSLPKDIGSLEQGCSELREQLSIVNRQLIAAKLRQIGVQDAIPLDSIDQKLERLYREIQELRKERRELKKGK
jgi:hypothetical protein